MTITAAEVDQVAAGDGKCPLYGHMLASAFRARATSNDVGEPWLLLASIFSM